MLRWPRWQGLSALPKNALENLTKWSATLVRPPLARTPPLPRSAFVAIILTAAVAMAAMFGVDAPASDWADHLPQWFIDAFEEITNFGLGGWFLIPSAFVFLCLAAVAAPILPRMTQGVLAALAARCGFLFLAVGAPGLFDTIVKRLIGRARPYVGSHRPLRNLAEISKLPMPMGCKRKSAPRYCETK